VNVLPLGPPYISYSPQVIIIVVVVVELVDVDVELVELVELVVDVLVELVVLVVIGASVVDVVVVDHDVGIVTLLAFPVNEQLDTPVPSNEQINGGQVVDVDVVDVVAGISVSVTVGLILEPNVNVVTLLTILSIQKSAK
jgi:hypothetical protein